MSLKANSSDEVENLNLKRSDYLTWEDYFMAVAFLSAQRSKDPSTQVGACIVNDENKIVGIGYNGMPNKCNDDDLPWGRESEEWLNTKYPYGIKEVVYFSDKHKHKDAMIASKKLLSLAGVAFRQHIPQKKQIVVDFEWINRRYFQRSTE